HPEVVALATKAKKIAVGKRCGRHSTAQHFINKRLVDAARGGALVVRLKGGDPMLFARAQEEIDALKAAGIEVEIVPGITAALAAFGALHPRPPGRPRIARRAARHRAGDHPDRRGAARAPGRPYRRSAREARHSASQDVLRPPW